MVTAVYGFGVALGVPLMGLCGNVSLYNCFSPALEELAKAITYVDCCEG